jgi:hypothetical protein
MYMHPTVNKISYTLCQPIMYSREKQNPYRKPNVHGKIENVAGSV